MVDVLDKMFNLGVGVVVMTKEKAEEIVNELIKKGEAGSEDAKKLVKDIMDRGEKNRQVLKEEIRNLIRETLRDMNIPSREDFDELKSEVFVIKESKPSEGELYQIRSDIAQIKAKLNM